MFRTGTCTPYSGGGGPQEEKDRPASRTHQPLTAGERWPRTSRRRICASLQRQCGGAEVRCLHPNQVNPQVPVAGMSLSGDVTADAEAHLYVPSTPEHLGCRMVAEAGADGGERMRFRWKSLVGARGFEPRTSSLSEKRSNRLSYAPTRALESTSAGTGRQPRASGFPSPASEPAK